MDTPNLKQRWINYPCPYCKAEISYPCTNKEGQELVESHISREPQNGYLEDPDRHTLSILTNLIVQGNGF
jgi:hypothetical protein